MSAVPAPFSLPPSWSWDGADGTWSTFQFSVGTPQQDFRVLPSTSNAETWIPNTDGCEGSLVNITDCGTLRGVDDFNGAASRGFQSNSSSTWDLIGIYELPEQNLWGPTGNQGLYGLDTVHLENFQSEETVELSEQTVAGVATANVWLGILGMGAAVAHFDVEPKPIPSLLETMRSQNHTPGLSFGYAAGASYTSPETPGSLILGGYDQARFHSNDVSFPFGGSESSSTLPVSIESIIAEDVFGGTLSLLPNGNSIITAIDSTVAQMWLPQNICDLFAQAFGLNYDSGTGFYLVNNTIHEQLTQTNPTVTFTLGATNSTSSTTNIILPYSAFDLQAGIPFFNYSTNYFPLRVAANESQQVLGRAFLQEAYVFVDWERDYFTISQAIHQNRTTDIVPVLSPSCGTKDTKSHSGLGTGAIAGIAIGACAAIVLLVALATILIIRSRRKRRAYTVQEKNAFTELPEESLKPHHEVMSSPVYEMHDGDSSSHKHELDAKPVTELEGDSLERELEGDNTLIGRQEKRREERVYYELP